MKKFKKSDKLDKIDTIFKVAIIGMILCLTYELGNAEFISIATIAIAGGGFAVIALASFLIAVKLKAKELRIKERSLREKERALYEKEKELNKRNKK
ncbi:hypothetical protein SY212_12550 [Ligilactobacillus agilis]|uniref:Uncharacterized protein n=1 Tax=Ligilactobacillus agilis TaxID=1601 RepID=A0A6F9XM05_9LACO|nr:hypothetical protein [Ligilactobacillus agilis]GET06225.1 hypothetical protein SY212_12550 [Ligilactobacillus agilis]